MQKHLILLVMILFSYCGVSFAMDQCRICYDGADKGALVALSCHRTHTFHERPCLENWKKVRPNCPMCNELIPTKPIEDEKLTQTVKKYIDATDAVDTSVQGPKSMIFSGIVAGGCVLGLFTLALMEQQNSNTQ